MAVIANHCVTPIVFYTFLLQLVSDCNFLIFLAKCLLSLCWLCPAAYLQTHTPISGLCFVPTKPIVGKMDWSSKVKVLTKWFEGSEQNSWKLKMEDRHKNRIQDNLSFLVKVWDLKLEIKQIIRTSIDQDTDYDRLRPELLKHKLFPATHLARMEERPNKKLELYLQVSFHSKFDCQQFIVMNESSQNGSLLNFHYRYNVVDRQPSAVCLPAFTSPAMLRPSGSSQRSCLLRFRICLLTRSFRTKIHWSLTLAWWRTAASTCPRRSRGARWRASTWQTPRCSRTT